MKVMPDMATRPERVATKPCRWISDATRPGITHPSQIGSSGRKPSGKSPIAAAIRSERAVRCLPYTPKILTEISSRIKITIEKATVHAKD